jgi:menaquinone-dependent protoporphyrinogen oxidase
MAARVLVAYATKLGSNGEIAEVIAETLRAAGHDAAAVPAHEVKSLAEWDAVVFGSAIYAAHWQRAARSFASRFRKGLTSRPLWLFSSGPLDPLLGKADLPITPHGAEITKGLGAIAHHTFGGLLVADAPVDPQILATHPIGDFRDWDAIRAYAAEIGEALSGMTFPAPDSP